MNLETTHEDRQWSPASGHLHMGGAPPTREQSVRIDTYFPLKLANYQMYDNIWFPVPPPETDLMEHLEALAIEAGYKDLKRSFAEIRIPDSRLWVLIDRQRDADAVKPAPDRQLRNALLLAKTGTLVYDPNIPPVFTRRRLQRSMTLINIPLENFYGLD